ncbi:MAG: putative quinol monooxygenase [Pseudomonadota bacterium]
MYVVTVEFEIKGDRIDAFMQRMMENALSSLDIEEGCLQFDVCQSAEDGSLVFLYEVYVDRDAFEVHLSSEHFVSFDKAVSSMIVAKSVTSWVRR